METLTLDYIQANRTKRATRGWKVTCPSCSGKDLWVTPSNGRGFCFECGTPYSIGDERRSFDSYPQPVFNVPAIRQIYRTASEHYHDCLTPDHRTYLANRGMDSTAVDLFRVGYCPAGVMPLYQTTIAKEAGIADRTGEPWLAERIVFPYVADGEVTDLRGRVLGNEEPRYKSLYHKSQTRGAVYPFNYDRAIARAKDTRTIIITEGEIKAAIADLHGFAAVALPGMLSWRPGFIANSDIKLVVMFDNAHDLTDRVRVDKAIYRLSKVIPYFNVGVLPLLGEQKMDIDTFLLHPKGGYSRFQYILDNACTYSFYRQLRRF